MSDRTGQPTEQPTQRRQNRAAMDGQVAYSMELVGGLIVLASIFFFMNVGTWFFSTTLDSIRQSLTFFHPMVEHPETSRLAFRYQMLNIGVAVISLMVMLATIAVLVGALQTRFNLSIKPLGVNWGKLSPKSGFKRIFSTRSVNRGGISIVKSIVTVTAAYWITVTHFEKISAAGMGSFPAMLFIGTSVILQIGLVTALMMVVVGVADFAFQTWKQKQDLMMTKQEVLDEQKEVDGDPQVKARIRKIRNEMSRQSVAREVPKATVIVTNPTHFAVALRYDPAESKAPIVVAKGTDHLAKHIIGIGKANGVSVVERKPVARFLYANVKVGQEIPLELYQAVAEILNYIRKLNRYSA